MKIKTSDLIGAQLDWAVAKIEGYEVDLSQNWHEATTCSIKASYAGGTSLRWANGGSYSPHTDPAQTWPIIDLELIALSPYGYTDAAWHATKATPTKHFTADGPTSLVAAMRCYVASELGDEVEIPNELL